MIQISDGKEDLQIDDDFQQVHALSKKKRNYENRETMKNLSK